MPGSTRSCRLWSTDRAARSVYAYSHRASKEQRRRRGRRRILCQPVPVQDQELRGQHKDPGRGRAVQAAAPPGHGLGHKGKDLAGQNKACRNQEPIDGADEVCQHPCRSRRARLPCPLSPAAQRPVPACIEFVVQGNQAQKEAACLTVPKEFPRERGAHWSAYRPWLHTPTRPR